MTKKDYALLAQSLNDALHAADPVSRLVVVGVMTRLCDDLRRANPAFRPDKFVAACERGIRLG